MLHACGIEEKSWGHGNGHPQQRRLAIEGSENGCARYCLIINHSGFAMIDPSKERLEGDPHSLRRESRGVPFRQGFSPAIPHTPSSWVSRVLTANSVSMCRCHEGQIYPR
jgi:hypothetical protein